MKNIKEIRRAVAILANRLNKKINNLSNAFTRAWQIIKCQLFISKVSGVTQGSRQQILRKLENCGKEQITVALERETGNAHDANAIRVLVSTDCDDAHHLGYIPNDLANLLAPLLDKGIELTRGKIQDRNRRLCPQTELWSVDRDCVVKS